MKTRIVAGLGITLVALGAGGWLWLDYTIRSEVDTRLQAAVDSGRYEALSYEDLHFNLKREITLEGFLVRQAGAEYMLDEVQLRNIDLQNEFPHHIDVSIRGLSFPNGLPQPAPDENPAVRQWLERLAGNGEAIPLQVDYSHQYDPENAWQLDSQSDVDIPGMLQLGMNSRLRNLSMETLAELEQQMLADPEQAQAMLLPVFNDAEFQSLALELTDSGFVQAMMEIGAADLQSTPEDYRTLLVSQARNAYLFMPATAQAFAREVGDELAVFLEGNRTLSLRLNPEFDGHVERLAPEIMAAAFTGDIGRVVQLLNLEVQTL